VNIFALSPSPDIVAVCHISFVPQRKGFDLILMLLLFLCAFFGNTSASLFNLTNVENEYHEEEQKHDSQHDPQVLILFFCVGLLLGGMVSFILSRLRSQLPFTVVMFIAGVILAIFVSFFRPHF
jgi:cell division protein FtsW (lipid II flippase)